MKLSYELAINKNEMNAVKDLALTIANEFGEKLNAEDLEQHFSHKVRVKSTGGNFLTLLNIGDTYECVVELEIADEVFNEIAAAIVEVLPMISGMIKTMTKLNDRLENLFKPTEIELDGEMQDLSEEE